jgi:hypothetical protein
MPQIATPQLPPMLTSTTVPAGIAHRQQRRRKFLALVKRPDGWWLDASRLGGSEPLWGPWATKAEATEAQRSYRRNGLCQPAQED